MRPLLKASEIAFAIVSCLPFAEAARLQLGQAAGEDGQILTVPLKLLDGGGDIAGLQFDLAFDPTVADVIGLRSGDAAPSHQTAHAGVDSGWERAVIASQQGSLLGDGTVAQIDVRLLGDVAEGQRLLSLTGVVVASSRGQRIATRLIPFAQITSVSDGEQFYPNGAVGVSAVAIDSDGDVVNVSFRVNGEEFASRTQAPFTATWITGELGDFLLETVVTDNSGDVVVAEAVSVSVRYPESATAWREHYFGANATVEAVAGFLANPDGDAFVNGVEYLLGGRPDVADLDLVKAVVISNGGDDYLGMEYKMPEAVTGVTHRVWVSDNLSNWRNGDGHTVEEMDRIDGLYRFRQIRSARPIDAKPQFFQLQVELDNELE